MPPISPKLISSHGNINIVFYNSWFYAVPQQLGCVFVDDLRPEEIARIGVFPTYDVATMSVTWRNYAMWPLWRFSILLRDLSFRIAKWTPPVRQPRTPA